MQSYTSSGGPSFEFSGFQQLITANRSGTLTTPSPAAPHAVVGPGPLFSGYFCELTLSGFDVPLQQRTTVVRQFLAHLTQSYAVGAIVSHACGQCLRYSIDLIPPPQSCGLFGWPGMAAFGMSESGEVCGAGGTCAKFQSAGFAWYGAYPLYYLPMPEGFSGGPFDINSARQMVGHMIPNGSSLPYHAFFHENGTTIDLGWLPGHSYSEAVGITDDGVVCATSWGLGSKVFIWQNGQISVLDLPLGPFNVAFGISDNHLVCGWMGEADTTVAHAFIHDLKTGQTFDIGTPLPGTMNAQATGVNNLTSVCGWSYSECGSQGCLGRRGFFWSKGQVQEIFGFPALPQVMPKSLNDSGAVVGACANTTGYSNAFVWQNGTTYRLQNLVQNPPAALFDIWIATSINNAGQIAAYGGY